MTDLEVLCAHVLFIDHGSVLEAGPLTDFVHRLAGKIRVSFRLVGTIPTGFFDQLAEATPGGCVLSKDPVEILLPDDRVSYTRLLGFLADKHRLISSLSIANPSLKDAWLTVLSRRGREWETALDA